MRLSPAVYILVACHNEKDRVINLLDDLSNQTYSNTHLVLVDDGSTDKTPELVKKKYSKVHIIHGNGKLWWTGSIAKGVKWILNKAEKKDYVITINSDCRVSKNFVKNLLIAIIKRKNTIIGSVIRDINTNKLSDSAIKINWKTGKFTQVLNFSKRKLINSDVLSTKGTIFPISIFTKIGNFNALKLPHYLSDYEFTLRAKESGYKLYTTPTSIVKNDTTRTGIGEGRISELGFYDRYKLLFDRKSKQNILDHYHFVISVAPSRYKLRNLFIIFAKSIYILFQPNI